MCALCVTCVCLVCDVFMFPRYKGKEIILYCYVDCSKLWSHIQEEDRRGVVIPNYAMLCILCFKSLQPIAELNVDSSKLKSPEGRGGRGMGNGNACCLVSTHYNPVVYELYISCI